MSFWQFLNQWWNLPYLVMLGLVAVFFALHAFGFVAGDAHPDLDHDVDVDGDVDADGDGDGDVDHDSEGFSLTGGAHVPFLVVWLTLFIFSGFAGLLINRTLQQLLGYRPWFFAPSLLGSLLLGMIAVRFVARQVAKLVDTGGRGSARRTELAGSIGVVASARLDKSFGEVRVRDSGGNELIVHGVCDSVLQQGEKVVLVELDKDSGLFQAAALKE